MLSCNASQINVISLKGFSSSPFSKTLQNMFKNVSCTPTYTNEPKKGTPIAKRALHHKYWTNGTLPVFIGYVHLFQVALEILQPISDFPPLVFLQSEKTFPLYTFQSPTLLFQTIVAQGFDTSFSTLYDYSSCLNNPLLQYSFRVNTQASLAQLELLQQQLNIIYLQVLPGTRAWCFWLLIFKIFLLAEILFVLPYPLSGHPSLFFWSPKVLPSPLPERYIRHISQSKSVLRIRETPIMVSFSYHS